MNYPIMIKGARTHNLKNVDLEIPEKKITIFSGVSGSGKSSLVFDTIYTESQRQLIETFSSFARRRLPKLSRPPVDEIKNISTPIIIDQKRLGRTLRSTVGTATELYTYLRLLFSRCGQPSIGPSFLFSFNHPQGMCPGCKGLGKRIRIDETKMIDFDKTIREGAIDHPDYKVGGWHWRELMVINLFDADKKIKDFSEEDKYNLLYAEAIEVEKPHGVSVYSKNFEGVIRKLERINVDKAEDDLSEARKTAYQKYFVYSDCDSCMGTRLNQPARSVRLNGRSIDELVQMELMDLDHYLGMIEEPLGKPMIMKMRQIIGHLIEIGVGYLSLNRSVATLSGGESQRVKMARQLDCDLVNMMYILDEPSIGLHPRDIHVLVGMLKKLRDKGNTVLVVEHDPDVITAADWVVEIGPKAGNEGGRILFEGTVKDLKTADTITSTYLTARKQKPVKRKAWKEAFEIAGASSHNLRKVDARIPKAVFTCITGVAGSGKSTLIHEHFIKTYEEAIVIDQTPVGRSSRSNPASYIGIFDLIRKKYAAQNNVSPSLFSFNSTGACPKCKGHGTLSIEMSFMDDVKMVCDECGGKRYQEHVLKYGYKGKSIDEILVMTVAEAEKFFEDKNINKRLAVLNDVGLDYLELGQPLSSLSGGEAQRIKLASELHKAGSVYVMDEPTTGLHMADIEKLIKIIKQLVDNNNTVIVIEHNLDLVKHADWVIDMGPEGGKKGGMIVAQGTPETVCDSGSSYTGRHLKRLLSLC